MFQIYYMIFNYIVLAFTGGVLLYCTYMIYTVYNKHKAKPKNITSVFVKVTFKTDTIHPALPIAYHTHITHVTVSVITLVFPTHMMYR